MGTVTDDCATVRISLGVYVLGAVEPVERAATESHLAGCPACRDELVQLAGLPGLLARLGDADLARETDLAVRPGLAVLSDAGGRSDATGAAERAIAELARRRHVARRRLAAAAAALVLLVAGVSVGSTVAATQPGEPGGTPRGRMISAKDVNTQVDATVWVADDPTGSAFTVRLRGVEPGTHCALVAVGTNGRREVAASWVANYHGAVDVQGASGISVGWLDRLLVVSDSGEELVAMELPASPR